MFTKSEVILTAQCLLQGICC